MVLFEWLNANTESFAKDVGLAGNDVYAFYPVLSFMICWLYLVTNKRKVIGDYFQGEEEFGQTHDVKVIAQLGLRFFTSVADRIGVYNQTTPEERNAREAEFINFVKVCQQQYNMKRTGMFMRTEIVSTPSQTTPGEMPVPHSSANNIDCVGTSIPQTSWWRAQYTFTSICDKEEPSVVRYLPMSYYLEGTGADGTRVYLYGPVNSLRIEADRDVTGPVPVDSIAWKMHLVLVDTNWQDRRGVPGVNSMYGFVCSQQNDKCVFSTLIDQSTGKAASVFVSRFQLRLESEPVSITANVYRGFLDDNLRSNEGRSLALFTVHPGRDLLLSYLCRALPELDSTVTWQKQKGNVLLIGGASVNTQLPLEIHVRSPEALNDKGDKFVAYSVKRVLIRYTADPPEPGDMKPDAASIRAVQFQLSNNKMLAQNVQDKTTWVIGETNLHRDATVDLLVLNKTPVAGGKSRKPGMSGGAQQPRSGGVIHFSDFPGVRQGFSMISVGKIRQDRLRSERSTASQDWNDLRVSWAFEESRDLSMARWRGVLSDRNTLAVVVVMTAVLLFGWKRATMSSVTSLGGIAANVTFGAAFVSFMVGLLEYIERIPSNFRPYEPVLFVLSGACLAVCMGSCLFASRFVPELSCTLYLSLFISVASSVFVYSFETASPVSQSPSVLSVKIGLLFVMAASLLLCAMEVHKLSRKTASDVNFVDAPLPTVIGVPSNVAFILMLVAVHVLVVGIAYLEMSSPGDKCDRVVFERNRANQNVHDSKNPKTDQERAAFSYFSKERDKKEREVDACVGSQYLPFYRTRIFSNKNLNDFIPFLVLALPLYLNMVAPNIGKWVGARYPSRLDGENPANMTPSTPMPASRIEDGRIPRPFWVVKTMVGMVMVFVIVKLLMGNADLDPGVCTHLRNMELENRNVTNDNSLQLDPKERMTLVTDGQWSFGCVPRETMSNMLVFGCISLVLLLSMVAPAKKRFAPTHTDAIASLGKLVYFVAVLSVMAWSWSRVNQLKILNMV